MNLPRLSLVCLGPLFSSSLTLLDLGDFGVIGLSDMTANLGPEGLGYISIRM